MITDQMREMRELLDMLSAQRDEAIKQSMELIELSKVNHATIEGLESIVKRQKQLIEELTKYTRLSRCPN